MMNGILSSCPRLRSMPCSNENLFFLHKLDQKARRETCYKASPKDAAGEFDSSRFSSKRCTE